MEDVRVNGRGKYFSWKSKLFHTGPQNFQNFSEFKKKIRRQITVILCLFGGFLFFYKSISDKHEWLYSQYTVSSLERTIKPKIIRKSRFFLIFFFKSSNCCTLFGKFSIFWLLKTKNFSKNSVNFETIPYSFGSAEWKIFSPVRQLKF